MRDYTGDSWEHTDAAPLAPSRRSSRDLAPFQRALQIWALKPNPLPRASPPHFPQAQDAVAGAIGRLCLPPSPHAGNTPGLPYKPRAPALHPTLPCTSLPHHGSCIAWELVTELPPPPHLWLQPRRSRVASEDQGGFDFTPPVPPMHPFRKLQACSPSTCSSPTETLSCSTCSISPCSGARCKDLSALPKVPGGQRIPQPGAAAHGDTGWEILRGAMGTGVFTGRCWGGGGFGAS